MTSALFIKTKLEWHWVNTLSLSLYLSLSHTHTHTHTLNKRVTQGHALPYLDTSHHTLHTLLACTGMYTHTHRHTHTHAERERVLLNGNA